MLQRAGVRSKGSTQGRMAFGGVVAALLLGCTSAAQERVPTDCAVKTYVYHLPWPFDDTKRPPELLKGKWQNRLAKVQQEAIEVSTRRGGNFVLPDSRNWTRPAPCDLRVVNENAAYLYSSHSVQEPILYRLRHSQCTTTNASEADLFAIPLLMLTKDSDYYQQTCSALEEYTQNYTKKLLPRLKHLNAATADMHFIVKGHYTGFCPGWWIKPIPPFRGVKKLIPAPLYPDEVWGARSIPYASVVSFSGRPWKVYDGRRPNLIAYTAKTHGKAGLLRKILTKMCAESWSCLQPSSNCVDSFWSAYENASYCLHPRGDTCERKGIIDSMLVGCVPVLFDECQLNLWEMHWGSWRAASCVFIDGDAVTNGTLSVEAVLRAIPPAELERKQAIIRANVWRMVYSAVETRRGDAISIFLKTLVNSSRIRRRKTNT